ncbi:MAG: DHH family phosphoesterase, partial [Oscillospiraceae bacterium]
NECNVSNFLASILVNRGHLSTLEAKQFIGEALEISSPFEMRDMTKAVDRIRSAIDNDEKIAVYGDYDCDGITSTCIVYSYLNSIGVDAVYYIPSRDDEGYGLNEDAIKQLFEQDVNLIITVDTGITAITQVEYANSL